MHSNRPIDERRMMPELSHLVGQVAHSAHRFTETLLKDLPEAQAAGTWPELSLTAVIESAERFRLAAEAERACAPELANRLENHPETRARLLIVNDARYQTWGLAEELITRSRSAAYAAEPRRGVLLGRLAASVGDHLDPECYTAALTADLRARAWGNLGNAYRCASQLKAAAAALRRAGDLLMDGTGDPLEEGNLLSLRASLAIVLGDYEGAIEILARAEKWYRELGETQLLGKTLVQRCIAAGHMDPEEGLRLAREAERMLDADEDPRLFLTARHNQIAWLVASGRPHPGQMLLEASRSLYRRFDDPWTLIHLGWNEARLYFALGELEAAEAAYEVLLDEVLARDYQLDGALAALDLAACRLARGRRLQASELAAEMARRLEEWGAHPRAREAWALFEHALAGEQASRELIERLASYLRRAWMNPLLVFSLARS